MPLPAGAGFFCDSDNCMNGARWLITVEGEIEASVCQLCYDLFRKDIA